MGSLGDEKEMFDAGVNSIVIGNYLTTTGDAPLKDITMLEKINYLKNSTNLKLHLKHKQKKKVKFQKV